MELLEAIRQRHSVRSYEEKAIEGETLLALEKTIAECNSESGLHIQLVRNEPKAFDSVMAHYGKFSGVTNYIAMIGKKSPDLDAALLAPTAMNQQKFRFDLSGDKIVARSGIGFCCKIDLGIAKYHFEIGSGKGKDVWV